MNSLLVASVVVLFLMFFAGVLFLLWVWFYKLEKEDDSNPPIVFNWVPSASEGYCIGSLVSSKKGRKGRRIVEFLPRDIDLDNPPSGTVKIVVDKVVSLPRGVFGGKRDIMMLLPKDATEFGREVADTWFGDMISHIVSEVEARDNIAASLKATLDRQSSSLERFAYGELSRVELLRAKEIADDSSKRGSGGFDNKFGGKTVV